MFELRPFKDMKLPEVSGWIKIAIHLVITLLYWTHFVYNITEYDVHLVVLIVGVPVYIIYPVVLTIATFIKILDSSEF